MATRPSGPPINPFPPEPKIPCATEMDETPITNPQPQPDDLAESETE